jgi:scyllo-inositol 2-dehydrogenase (NADP+)
MNNPPKKQKSGSAAIRTAISGFGLSGQIFHAPFLEVNPHFILDTIVSSGTIAAEKYPNVHVTKSFTDMLSNPEIQLVIVCSPNIMHFEQAALALKAGKHVIVEKPMTVSSAEAERLINLSMETRKFLFPFHNRRWDGDFLSVRNILSQGLLGRVLEFESRMERFTPAITRAAWRYQETAGGGTLFDLGIHLIDQAVCLFGKPEGVFCRLFNQREGSITDDSFDLRLFYPGTSVTLKAGVFVREPGARFQVHGTEGSYVKYGTDPQEAQLREGKLPGSRGFGIEPEKSGGILNTLAAGHAARRRFKTFPGNYMAFFDNVHQVLSGAGEPVVKPGDALLNIRIIEAAKESHTRGCIIPL